ncbi:MAG: hypothetical protein CL781_05565 [Chloroflexi bacterium]|nr:hypothetical protein [Chloroflexota bacterium]
MDKNNFSRDQYARSLKRLEDIFRDISHSADEVSKWRCPYKNVQDRCTAKFGCRNQDRNVPIDELYVCIGSDDIDYRPAWQV